MTMLTLVVLTMAVLTMAVLTFAASNPPAQFEQRTASNFLVEEFMLLANIHVAQIIADAFPDRCAPLLLFTTINPAAWAVVHTPPCSCVSCIVHASF